MFILVLNPVTRSQSLVLQSRGAWLGAPHGVGVRGGSTTGGLQAASSCLCPPRLCLEHLSQSPPQNHLRGAPSFPLLSQKRAFCPGKPPRLRRRLVRDVYFCISSCARVFCVSAVPGVVKALSSSPHGRAPASQGGSGSSQSRTTAWPCPARCWGSAKHSPRLCFWHAVRGIKG